MSTERHEAIVIGAGQTGLAAARRLVLRGVDTLVLESEPQVGDVWRRRYESLRLYSPARYDMLPGLPMPMDPWAFPTGAEMADYLAAYAERFDLPVLTSTPVSAVRAADDGPGYVVEAAGRTFHAENVVVASGFFRRPAVPAFASELDPGIRQFHSSTYRRPSDLVEGPVLVVGRGHSGADLAMEAAESGHHTILAGRSHGQLPFSVDSLAGRLAWPVMRWVAMNVLTLRTPIGRKMAVAIRHGGAPLLRHRRGELLRAGVELADGRVQGAEDGRPVLANGRVVDVANVIWATGFRPDYEWIHLPVLDAEGWPIQDRGVVPGAAGLYFLGVVFQSGFGSMLVIGADRDAKRVVDHIAARRGSTSPATSPAATAAQS